MFTQMIIIINCKGIQVLCNRLDLDQLIDKRN